MLQSDRLRGSYRITSGGVKGWRIYLMVTPVHRRPGGANPSTASNPPQPHKSGERALTIHNIRHRRVRKPVTGRCGGGGGFLAKARVGVSGSVSSSAGPVWALDVLLECPQPVIRHTSSASCGCVDGRSVQWGEQAHSTRESLTGAVVRSGLLLLSRHSGHCTWRGPAWPQA